MVVFTILTSWLVEGEGAGCLAFLSPLSPFRLPVTSASLRSWRDRCAHLGWRGGVSVSSVHRAVHRRGYVWRQHDASGGVPW